MQRAARLLALLSLFGLVLVSPAGAVCPANTLYANGTTTQSTNPTASLSQTVGCYPYGDASGSASYNLRDRKSTRLNSSHIQKSRMPSSA